MVTLLWILGIGTLLSTAGAIAFGVRSARSMWKGDMNGAGKNFGGAFVANAIAGLFWLAFIITGIVAIIGAITD